MVCDSRFSNWVRDQAALAVLGLVKFNKDVFVGLVLMGPIVRALIQMDSSCLIQVLTGLVKIIRTPLVECGEIVEKFPFSRCVSSFAVQMEVGEGLEQSEKRAFKLEILKRVREAYVSDVATVVAEVLLGSSPKEEIWGERWALVLPEFVDCVCWCGFYSSHKEIHRTRVFKITHSAILQTQFRTLYIKHTSPGFL
ncbi:hypothetical protein L3X38_004804 [Prunus dulcis]|uniref:Uncharacterized protein n=1 Tax=Prunus dulcis TaxID=3755 RepID=A0AAD4ZPM6_PRUDU|nr:hypothetical protein L3X38_004804 [Prunus dulcis]